jgi:membrane protein implicated in regulation of membrane protease activity
MRSLEAVFVSMTIVGFFILWAAVWWTPGPFDRTSLMLLVLSVINVWIGAAFVEDIEKKR